MFRLHPICHKISSLTTGKIDKNYTMINYILICKKHSKPRYCKINFKYLFDIGVWILQLKEEKSRLVIYQLCHLTVFFFVGQLNNPVAFTDTARLNGGQKSYRGATYDARRVRILSLNKPEAKESIEGPPVTPEGFVQFPLTYQGQDSIEGPPLPPMFLRVFLEL